MRAFNPPNVVGPKMFMVPVLLTLESPKALVPSVFQVPALAKLLLRVPVIATVPVTTPPVLLVNVALPTPKAATARLPGCSDKFWIVAELLMLIAPRSEPLPPRLPLPLSCRRVR